MINNNKKKNLSLLKWGYTHVKDTVAIWVPSFLSAEAIFINVSEGRTYPRLWDGHLQAPRHTKEPREMTTAMWVRVSVLNSGYFCSI